MKKSLTVLDAVTVKSPCFESWDGMAGDEKIRFCKRCNHSVFNISAMTRREAEELMTSKHQGRLCIRYNLNHDGTTRYKISPSRLRMVWQSLAIFVVTMLSFVGLPQYGQAQDSAVANDQNTESPDVVMGKMVVKNDDKTASPTASPTPILEPNTSVMLGEFEAKK